MLRIPQTLNSSKQRLLWMVGQARQWQTGISEVDTVLLMAWYYLSSIELRLPALPLHLDKRLHKPSEQLEWLPSNKASMASRPRTKTRPA
jgi:hypothetical protein